MDSCWSPADALRQVARLPHALLLESSLRMTNLGRYSFLMADPVQWFEVPVAAVNQQSDLFKPLEDVARAFQQQTVEGLPPFQGGIAGLISYDANRAFENIPSPTYNEFRTPAIAFGVYDVVLAFDHVANRSFLLSNGFPETDTENRKKLAIERLEFFWELLHNEPVEHDDVEFLQQPEICPQHTIERLVDVSSNFSEPQYLEAVQKAIEYIHAGDVFQVNIAQRLLRRQQFSSLQLYQNLRQRNAAPFSAYFDLDRTQIVSASPERFVSVLDGFVETRPIKGTRRRTRYPEVDLNTSIQLQTSEKDRAENIMIVDLMRNDLSRVCTDHSIQVRDLCKVEAYESVLHLVSSITGELQPNKTVFDLLRASFPGGSITGAPKVRAMEIIAELEPVARGAYCGSLGYIGFNGNADFNILIRTITVANGWWQIPVGGGIVADSNPTSEYDETWTKAASLLRATQK